MYAIRSYYGKNGLGIPVVVLQGDFRLHGFPGALYVDGFAVDGGLVLVQMGDKGLHPPFKHELPGLGLGNPVVRQGDLDPLVESYNFV